VQWRLAHSYREESENIVLEVEVERDGEVLISESISGEIFAMCAPRGVKRSAER
jgi:hypothetical protein